MKTVRQISWLTYRYFSLKYIAKFNYDSINLLKEKRKIKIYKIKQPIYHLAKNCLKIKE